jgi:hypothetical protein
MGRLLTGQVQVNYVLIHAQVLKSAVLHVSYNILRLGETIHPSHQKSHHAKMASTQDPSNLNMEHITVTAKAALRL